MTNFRWRFIPGCPCADCADHLREQEPAYKFQTMEDERAEFETTFRALGYEFLRRPSNNPLHRQHAPSDYHDIKTAHAWLGWLQAAKGRLGSNTMSAELEREIFRLRTAIGFILSRIDAKASTDEVRALLADVNYQSAVRASQRAGIEHAPIDDKGSDYFRTGNTE